jgi:TcdA/TcdB catalytic glycosyltransferase domain
MYFGYILVTINGFIVCRSPMSVVPKEVHGVWLGGNIKDAGKKNIVDWAKRNGQLYNINLWVDSSTFTKVQLTEFKEEILPWAELNNIIIHDVNHAPSTELSNRLPHFVNDSTILREIMDNEMRSYYQDELIGAYKNLAAASDILRLYILKQYGGVYIDVEDIHPNEPLPQLVLSHGFQYHQPIEGSASNDIMISTKNSQFVDEYIAYIREKYRQLYSDTRRLDAHRDTRQMTINDRNFSNYRFISTLELSGPNALKNVSDSLTNNYCYVRENNERYLTPHHLSIPQQFFFIPEKQSSSWYDAKSLYSHERLSPIFRNSIQQYYNEKIKGIINIYENKIGNAMLLNPYKNSYKEKKQLFEKIYKRINSYNPQLSLSDIYENATKEFSLKELAQIEKITPGLLKDMSNAFHNSDELFDHLSIHYDMKQIYDFMDRLGSKFYQEVTIEKLINDILIHDELNIEYLQDYVLSSNIGVLTPK